MKIVGVRPLSKHFFELYPEETQKLRIRNKPGLFPPFYVDLPSNFEEVVASEKKYLELYQKHKLKTDFTYFFKIAKNIIFKNARSK
jgi:lipopolysaccharide/colanic/teichoic acid biosynthesis glycosyltransferase